MSEARYPLKSWSVGGFRSIEELTQFALGGLNVLVGANSAGKSSVLYSILMAAQSLESPVTDKPLVLNGPLARLGLPDDILHASEGRSFELALELNPAGLPEAESVEGGEDLTFGARMRFNSSAPDKEFELTNLTLQSLVGGEANGEIEIARRSASDAQSAYEQAGLDEASAESYAVLAPFGLRGDSPGEIAGVTMRQFLPSAALQVVNRYEWQLERLGLPVWESALRSRRFDTELPPELGVFLDSYLKAEFGEEASRVEALEDALPVGELRKSLPPEQWRAVQVLTRSNWFIEHKDELPFDAMIRGTAFPQPIEEGIDRARKWFATNVRHLGPIRAAPQPLYGLPEAASGTSVGRSGEYTAAVLNAHQNREVECPFPQGGATRRVRLSTAVDLWMNSLGLISGIQSTERGKLGFELKVSMEGVEKELDLTTVGVGVSQALPIVVLGLISPPGSLLLLEQPELHLHPNVQASLGDFLLALSESGRQVVVETHSEYLINRLRLRAAEEEGEKVAQKTRLFFFERSGGQTSVRSARVGLNGGTHDWPEGFLDTAAREVESIANAVVARVVGEPD